MKSILDSSFEYTPSYETDIRHTFARVWRELGEREEAEADPGDYRDSLWLECNGELVDAASVEIVGVRVSALQPTPRITPASLERVFDVNACAEPRRLDPAAKGPRQCSVSGHRRELPLRSA